METSGVIRNDRYERISSSGMVFNAKPTAKGKSKNAQINGILTRLIEEEIELSIRSLNCLNSVGIKLIGQLVQKSASELLDLRNFGRKSLCEIEKILTEMGLILEMTLDFPPWNGEDNGNQLIRILSLQKPGGGFHIDDHAAVALDLDLKEVNQELRGSKQVNKADKLPILHTKYLLDLLESKFDKEMPYLTGLIKSHRKWLETRLRQGHS
jgi:hypothetical protein